MFMSNSSWLHCRALFPLISFSSSKQPERCYGWAQTMTSRNKNKSLKKWEWNLNAKCCEWWMKVWKHTGLQEGRVLKFDLKTNVPAPPDPALLWLGKKSEIMPWVLEQPSIVQVMRQKPHSCLGVKLHHFPIDWVPRMTAVRPALCTGLSTRAVAVSP